MTTRELPAILIGGPPHAGKSVLFYSITSALKKRSISHHAIRACPDGEGNWSQEGDQETISHIRDVNKGKWSDEFVERICQNIKHRCFPFLVDMGAYPTLSQQRMLQLCTHAILLLRADKSDDTHFWEALIVKNDLTLLARINSQRDGESILVATCPAVEGTLVGLERYESREAQGTVFEALIDSIVDCFSSSMPQDLNRFYCEQAPTQLLNLYDTVSQNEFWELSMLSPFLLTVPTHVSISVFGRAPGWVYAAIAAVNEHALLYQFDPRLNNGWVQSLAVKAGTEPMRDLDVSVLKNKEFTILHVNIRSKHLNYLQPDPLVFPVVSTAQGIVIDGVIPYWLLTSLVRLYKELGVPWIAYHYVQARKFVVVYSRHQSYQVGDYITPAQRS